MVAVESGRYGGGASYFLHHSGQVNREVLAAYIEKRGSGAHSALRRELKLEELRR